MDWFVYIQDYYNEGFYNDEDVYSFVEFQTITKEQYEEIVKKLYE